jgi:PPE-repeat protein
MSFTAAVPEVIAAEVYTGGDHGQSLIAAAGALVNLASALEATASTWQTTLDGLATATGWIGAGAAAASLAGGQYISWLQTTLAEVEAAYTAVTQSYAAYEIAATPGVGVWDPATVLTNRTDYYSALAGMPLTVVPVTTLESDYLAMASQDVLAMNTYAVSDTTAAAHLTPPISVTGEIVPIAPLTDAGSGVGATAGGLGSTLSDLYSSIDGLLGTPALSNSVNGAVNTAAWFVGNTIPTAVSLGHTLAGAAVPALAVGDVVPDGSAAGVVEGTMVSSVRPMGVGSWAGMGASAGVGEATTVGKLSVPATWAGTAAQAELASATAPLEGSGWSVAAEEAGAGGMGAPGMPGMVGGAGGKGAAGAFAGPRYGTKPIVMPKSVVV